MEKDMTLACEHRSMTTFTAFAGIATRALALAANGVLKNVRNGVDWLRDIIVRRSTVSCRCVRHGCLLMHKRRSSLPSCRPRLRGRFVPWVPSGYGKP